MALGTVAIALAIGLSVWHETTEPEAIVAEPAGRGPSIMVLPFDNLSDEPAKAYLAGGLTEEILTGLAQFKELFVYAHETGARYGSATNYRELHRELGVRYVLQGSVREAAGRIRVTARLVDATIGAQLWASAYEEVGSGADLFQIQSDIARRVVVEVAQPYGIIATADLKLMRGKAPESLSAYDCVLQVLDHYRHMSAARVEEARSCLEQATKSDPEYADAWALLGMSYLDQIRLRMAPRSQDKELLDRALWAAHRAAEIAPDSALAQRSLLLVHSFRGEVDQALAAGERAITLSPNNAEILAEFGMRVAMMGQWERGISLIGEAIARNPAHPGWYHTAPALNFYRQGRYAEALEEARQIDAPGWVHNHTILAMIYGQLGQEEQARAAARQHPASWIRISRRTPGTSFSSAISRSRWRSTWPRVCAKPACIFRRVRVSDCSGQLVSVDSEIGQVSRHTSVTARILPLRTSELWSARRSLGAADAVPSPPACRRAPPGQRLLLSFSKHKAVSQLSLFSKRRCDRSSLLDLRAGFADRLGAGLAQAVLVHCETLLDPTLAGLDVGALALDVGAALVGEIGNRADRPIEYRYLIVERLLALAGELVAVGVEAGELPVLARDHLAAIGPELGVAGLFDVRCQLNHGHNRGGLEQHDRHRVVCILSADPSRSHGTLPTPCRPA